MAATAAWPLPAGTGNARYDPVEAELDQRGIVERRRQRVPDRVADHAGDHRRGCRPRTETTTLARATAAR